MTPEQLNSEIAWYAFVGRDQHPDTKTTIYSIDAYTDEQKDMALAEIAYYYERGKLPFWASMIERVDVVDGNRVFIHADKEKATA